VDEVAASFGLPTEGVSGRREKDSEHSYLDTSEWDGQYRELIQPGLIRSRLTILIPDTRGLLYHNKLVSGRDAILRESERVEGGCCHDGTSKVD
jgi:hypothetical protein